MARKKLTLNEAPQQINLNQLLKEYTQEKSIYSDATVRNYKHKITPFINWAEQYLDDNSLNQATINSFIVWLNQQYTNKTTVNSYLRAIKAFLNWMYENDYIKIKPSISIREVETYKEVYTSEELKILLTKPQIKTFADYRNWAMINFFIGTGCRRNTLINVKLGDVDLNSDMIVFRVTKSGKQQIVPLSITLKKVLKEYIKKINLSQDDYLFPNAYGEKLTPNAVTHIVRDYNVARGINKTSCHLFRHTFAHNYLLNGGDVFRLQKLLGHSTLEITKVYANMDISALQKDYDSMNLLDTIASSNQHKMKYTKDKVKRG